MAWLKNCNLKDKKNKAGERKMKEELMPKSNCKCCPTKKAAFSIGFLLSQLREATRCFIVNGDSFEEINEKLKEIIQLNEEAIDDDICAENTSTLRFEVRLCSSYPGRAPVISVLITPIIAGENFVLVPFQPQQKTLFLPL